MGMNITIASIGKTGEKNYAALEEAYLRRIHGRFTAQTHYVKSEKELLQFLQKVDGSIVLLDENGSVMNSREFAQYVDREIQQAQANHLIFIIGDAQGLSADLRALPADIVALSEMTFPHEMARVIVLEQLYRAQTILSGHPYHK